MPPPAALDAADALADLATLERILRTGYIGFDYFRQLGVDWDALFAQAAVALAAHGDPLSFCDFAVVIDDLFQSVTDRHLSVWPHPGSPECPFQRRGRTPVASATWFRLEGDAAIVDDGAPARAPFGSRLLDCAGREAANDLHFAVRKKDGQWQFGYRLIYTTTYRPDDIDCRFRTPDGAVTTARIAVEPIWDWRRETSGKLFAVKPGETMYVRLGAFDPEHEADISPFVQSAAAAAQARAIIVDLRGNRGGTDFYFHQWARALMRGETWFGEIVRLESETALQGEINAATEERAYFNDSISMRALLAFRAATDLAALFGNAVVRFGAPWRRIERFSARMKGRAQRPFGGRMLVIVDRACASACEGSVMLARHAFDAVVVGVNTAGVHAFIEPHPFRLPKSGLEIRAARKMMDPERVDAADFREGRGFMPDVWLDLRDDGAAAREFGACLADPRCADDALSRIKVAGERQRELSIY
jgi:hypothetical protein